MPLSSTEISASWNIAEQFLEQGQVETAVCTLHGLLLSASNQHNQFPPTLFQAEVLTRLRLSHCLIHLTSNTDAGRRVLEELLPRFEGYFSSSSSSSSNDSSSASSLFSSSSKQTRKSNNNNNNDSSSSSGIITFLNKFQGVNNVDDGDDNNNTSPEVVFFNRKFPFSVHVLKSHCFRLIGEAWLKKGGNKQNILKALQYFHDAASIIKEVLDHTKNWIGINSNNSNSNSNENKRRRERQEKDNDDAKNQNAQQSVNNKEEMIVSDFSQKVWKIASFRIASMLLSLRCLETVALHWLATNSSSLDSSNVNVTNTSNNNSGSTTSTNDSSVFARKIVSITTIGLKEYFDLTKNYHDDDANVNNNENENKFGEVVENYEKSLSFLFQEFDSLVATTTEQEHDNNKNTKTTKTKIRRIRILTNLLTPTLASVALYHVVGMLLTPTGTSLQQRAVRLLRFWSSQQQQQQQENEQESHSFFSSSGKFTKFSHLWKFLLMLSNPQDSSLGNDIFAAYNNNNIGQEEEDPNSPFNVASEFETLSSSKRRNSRTKLLNDDDAVSSATSSSGSKNNKRSNTSDDDSYYVLTSELRDWLSAGILDSGTIKCATGLVCLIRQIQFFSVNSNCSSATNSNSNNNEDIGAVRSQTTLDSLNELMLNVEDQLRRLTTPGGFLLNLNNNNNNNNTLSSASSQQQTDPTVILSYFTTNRLHQEVKFLVSVKVSAYSEMALFDLMNLDLCSAIMKLDSLRQYVALFKKHTLFFRSHMHFLISLLALYLGNRDALQTHAHIMQDLNSSSSSQNNSNSKNKLLKNQDQNSNEEIMMTLFSFDSIPTSLHLSYLVEAISLFSLMKASSTVTSLSNKSSSISSSFSISERRQLQQRFDVIIDEAQSSFKDQISMFLKLKQQQQLQQQQQEEEDFSEEENDDESPTKNNNNNNNNNNKQQHQQRVTSQQQVQTLLFKNLFDSNVILANQLLLWKILFAAKNLQDRDAPQALEELRYVVDVCVSVRGYSSSSNNNNNNNSTTNSTDEENSQQQQPKQQQQNIPCFGTQYILATALRLIATAHSMLGDVNSGNSSISASCRASAVVHDEQCSVHCLAWALNNIVVVASEKDAWKQRELHSQVKKVSETFGAQVKLILNGPLSSSVDSLIAFKPGNREYENWCNAGSSSSSQNINIGSSNVSFSSNLATSSVSLR